MPKRKRSQEESVQSIFTRLRTDVFHALKHAKGFERQRQSKRLRDAKATPDKKARIEREIVVLKSLDLQQTAHAHLCSSLLRIKGIAESDKVPDEIKAGVPKPDLTKEEKTALHNVTSALYNQKGVKEVIDQAIAAVCGAVRIPVPDKKSKSTKKNQEVANEEPEQEEPKEVKEEWTKEKDKSKKDEPKKKKEEDDASVKKIIKEKAKDKEPEVKPELEDEIDDETMEKAVEELQDLLGSDSEDDEEEEQGEEFHTADEEAEGELDDDELEKTVSKMEGLLGSDSEDEDEDEEKLLGKARAQPKKPLPKDLDPMEITSDEEAGDEADDDDEDDDLDPMEITDEEPSPEEDEEDVESDAEDSSESEFEGFSDANSVKEDGSGSEDVSEEEQSDASSSSVSSIDRPPPAKRAKPVKIDGNSIFLPTLMGGYISGSESASDVDIAPVRKNRRGQRARQQIWEKKYKDQAKHLAQQKAARDSGWDLKRGAVDSDSKPWKKGIKNPLLKKPAATGANETKVVPKNKERVRDDAGALHPSWEAKRLAKEKERLTAPFQGKKITFD